MSRNNHRELPPNLYKSKGYFRYRHPITKKWFYLGGNRETAIEEALQINVLLSPQSEKVKKILNSEQSKNFSEFIEYYAKNILPTQNLAQKTIQDYLQKIPHIKKDLGRFSIEKITTKHITDFLNQYPPTQSNYYRAVLSVIFKHAIAEGFTDKNPAAATLKKTVTKQRLRLPLEHFEVIRSHATEWLKNAMDLALITGQRRKDIANLKWTDIHDGFVWIQQHKTHNRIKINLSENLSTVLIKCTKENEFVIGEIRGNEDKITKAFAEAREKSGLKTNATFHEIRSLSGYLYEQAGIEKREIQMLFGHSSEKMTEHYLEGHEEKWTEVVTTNKKLIKR